MGECVETAQGCVSPRSKPPGDCAGICWLLIALDLTAEGWQGQDAPQACKEATLSGRALLCSGKESGYCPKVLSQLWPGPNLLPSARWLLDYIKLWGPDPGSATCHLSNLGQVLAKSSCISLFFLALLRINRVLNGTLHLVGA